MPYQPSGRLADLLIERGRVAGDRARTSGAFWGNAVRGIAALPGQVQQRRAAEAEAQQAAIDRDLSRQKTLTDMASTESLTQGRLSEQARAEEARAVAAKTEQVNAWLGEIASQTDLDVQRAAYRSGRSRLLEAGVLSDGDAPEYFPGTGWVKSKLALTLPAAERFKALFPEEKAPEPFTLSPGQQRFGPDGQPIASVAATPDAPAGFTLSEGQVRYGPDGAVIARGPAKVDTPEDPLARRERELRIAKLEADLKNASTGPATPAKLEAVAPVLDEIEALSKKIFTTDLGPVTNVIGVARRGLAAVNLDNDVKEYRSLVRGFTPLMARAVGHNGVLTEQDVERTEMLFGDVGWLGTDNKTVAENKMARLKTIMVGGGTEEEKAEIRRLMGWDVPRGGAPPTRGGGAGPAGRIYYDANGNRIQR